MSIVNKVTTLIKDYDFRQFAKFIICHPSLVISNRKFVNRFPDYLNDLINGKNSKCLEYVKSLHALSEGDRGNNHSLNMSHKCVRLAGETIQDFSFYSIDWNRSFKDPEDMAAYQRFIWLYKEIMLQVSKGNDKTGLNKLVVQIIYSWIDTFLDRNKEEVHFEIWQTYTVVERITNWLLVLSVTSETDFENTKIANAVVEQLNYICDNFEYYGETFTGNHFFNNGKGLYIAGSILGLDYFTNIGKEIIINEANRVIQNKTFLREGSTHYQFLFTKWVSDIYWVAGEYGDIEFIEEVERLLDALIKGCSYYLQQDEKGIWNIPLIGDISPDYPPEWIIGVPWVAKYLLSGETFIEPPQTEGYHTFFLLHADKEKMILNPESYCEDVFSNDIKYISDNNFKLWAKVNNSLYPNNLTGHFHHDSGSISLYYRGQCILADCGRLNYSIGEEGRRGKDFYGHNLLVIDNINPEINMRTFFPDEFLERYVHEKPIINCKENTIEMVVSGYSRLKGIDTVIRKVSVEKNAVKLRDVITGVGTHNILIQFHVMTDADVLENGFRVSTCEGKIDVLFDKKPDEIEIVDGNDSNLYGHCATEYGEDNIIKTVLFKKKVKLPYEAEIVIRRI